MKKELLIFLVIIIIFLFYPFLLFITGFDSHNPIMYFFPPDTKNVSIDLGTSEIYSEEDRASVADLLIKDFQDDEYSSHYDCTLTEVRYAGDKWSMQFQKDYSHYGYDEVITFYYTYITGHFAYEVGGQNKNDTISDVYFICGRNKDGDWEHFMGGYAKTVPLRYLALSD